MRLSIKLQGLPVGQIRATDVYRHTRLSLTRLGLKRVRLVLANVPEDEPDNYRCTIVGETADGVELVEQLTGAAASDVYDLTIERFRRRIERIHRRAVQPSPRNLPVEPPRPPR